MRDGRIIGSVFVVDAGQGVAQLRLLYVEPEARGLGVGKVACRPGRAASPASERYARRSGCGRRPASSPPESSTPSAGFTLTESKPHHSFGKDLVGEYWELTL
jgi:GNAT superfamily N-acetyltransferase